MKTRTVDLCLALVALFFLAACAGQVNGVPEPRPSSDSSIASGHRLIARYGCGSCHTIPGIPGAHATVGPPLNRFYERSFIAGRLPNTWDNLIKWIQNPQQIDPGNAMPNLGVSADEAHDMASYLYHEQTLGDLLSH